MHKRIQMEAGWTLEYIKHLAEDQEVGIVQYSEPLYIPDMDMLRMLNEELFRVRPDIVWRIYGFHLKPGDLSGLEQMSYVEKLCVDCNTRVTHMEAIGALPKLKELELDVHEADSLSVLETVPADLRLLRIGKTKTKKTDLSVLKRFTHLETLSVNGHQRNLSVIGELTSLRQVTLQGMPLEELEFLRELPLLESLGLSFGSAEHLGTLAGLEALQHLELLRVKGLSDLSVVSELTGLRNLKVEDQPHLAELPALDHLSNLHRIILANVGLKSLEWVQSSQVLEELAMFEMKTLTVEDIERCVQQPNSLRRMLVGLKSLKSNKLARQVVEEAGLWDDRTWWL